MGIEYKFLPHWSTKLEYNFIDFGNQTTNFPITVGVTGLTLPATAASRSCWWSTGLRSRDYQHIIKAGVNYDF